MITEQTETKPQTYANQGYLLANQVFSTSSVDALRKSFRTTLAKCGNLSPNNGHADRGDILNDLILRNEREDHSSVYKASQSVGSSAAAYQLLGGSDILNLVATATGFEIADLHLAPLYFIVQNPRDERFDYPWHQDGAYYPWAKDMLTLWFPVNRAVTRETGTISVIPSSHQVQARKNKTYVKHGFFRQIESEIDTDEASREMFVEVEPGDCCIMHGDLVHRSVANHSNTPRVAGVVRLINVATLSSYERDLFYCSHKS